LMEKTGGRGEKHLSQVADKLYHTLLYFSYFFLYRF
jgi:hypothetical protein